MIIQPSNRKREIRLRKLPKHCPYCHHGIAPVAAYSVAYSNKAPGHAWVDVAFSCPLCHHLFVATFERDSSTLWLRGQLPEYVCSGLAKPKPTFEQLPSTTSAVSPAFVHIYEQAQAAEQAGLDQITGQGYRKALEFLVKDYLISLDPVEEESIKQAPLGNCVKKLADERIRVAAERAVWLGNDETHYVRVWRGMDVSDLKELIQLVLSHLHAEAEHIRIQIQMPTRAGNQPTVI